MAEPEIQPALDPEPPPVQRNVNLYGFTTAFPPSAAEERLAEATQTQRISDLGLNAFEAAWAKLPTSYIFDQFERGQIATDSSYRLTEERFKEVSVDIPPDWWEEFGNAESDAELEAIRAQLMRRAVVNEKLSSLGWVGVPLQLAAGMFDPATAVAVAATAGLGSVIGLGSLAGRTGAAVRNGLVGAASMTAIESYVASQDPDVGGRDVLYAAAGGLILGGVFGGTFHGTRAEMARIETHARRLRKTIEYQDLRAASGKRDPDLTPKGEANFRPGIGESAVVKDTEIAGVVESIDGGKTTIRVNPEMTVEVKTTDLRPDVLDARATSVPADEIPKSTDISTRAGQIMDENPDTFTPKEAMDIARREIEIEGEKVATSPPPKRHLAPDELDPNKPLGQQIDEALAESEAATQPTPPAGAAKGKDTALPTGTHAEITAFARRGIDDSAKKPGPPPMLTGGVVRGKLTPHTVTFENTATKERTTVTVNAKDAGDARRRAMKEGNTGRILSVSRSSPTPGTTIRTTVAESLEGPQPRGPGATTPAGIVEAPPRGDKPSAIPDYSYVSDAKGSGTLGFKGIGMTDMLVQSESGQVRQLGRILGQEVIPDRDGVPTTMSTAEAVHLNHGARMNRFADVAAPAFRQWSKQEGMRFWQKRTFLNRFYEEVGRAIPDDPGKYTNDPNVNAVADHLRTMFANDIKYGQKARVKGFEKLDTNPRYLPHSWRPDKILNRIKTLKGPGGETGQSLVHRLLAEGIVKANPELTPKQAATLSKAIVNRATNPGLTTEIAFTHMLDDAEYMREVMRDAGVGDTEIADILFALKPKEKEGISQTRHRIPVNEQHSVQAIDEAGNTVTLRVLDLMENNALVLYNRYGRSLEGAALMTEVYRAMGVTPDDTIGSLPALLERVRKDSLSLGMPEAQVATELGKIETLARHTLGLSLERGRIYPQSLAAGEDMAMFLQSVRSFQHARLMGSAVWNNVIDIAGAIAESGGRTFFDAVPNIKAVLPDMIRGKVSNELLREWRAIGSMGSDVERHGILSMMDNASGAAETSGAFGKFRRGMDRVGNFQARFTGLEGTITFMQRVAVVLAEQKWANIARSGKFPSERRLAGMGLDRGKAERITESMKTHGKFEGDTLVRLNHEKWDPEVLADYVNAIEKWSRRNAQTNDIGSLSQWMTTEVGKSLIQFRGFNVVALNKQLRYGIHMQDWTSFANFATQLFMGSVSYGGRIYVASLGLPEKERKKFIEERLIRRDKDDVTYGPWVRGAFSRAPFASVLPMIVDAGSFNGKLYAKQFSGTRASGLEADPIFGNPTADFLNRITDLPGAVLAPLRTDRRFTRGDLNTIRQAVPLQNAIGLKNVLDAIGGRLPKSSKERSRP